MTERHFKVVPVNVVTITDREVAVSIEIRQKISEYEEQIKLLQDKIKAEKSKIPMPTKTNDVPFYGKNEATRHRCYRCKCETKTKDEHMVDGEMGGYYTCGGY